MGPRRLGLPQPRLRGPCVAGAVLKGPAARAPWPGIALLQYARALPDPFREDLGRALRARGPGLEGSARQALRGQREALATALTAEPYAPDTVAALFARETEASRPNSRTAAPRFSSSRSAG